MKANAPEKIYLDEDESWHLTNPNGDSVEYVRTNAFIKKAEKFMNTVNEYLYHCVSEECDYVDTDKFIEDFKNYMKGE